MSSKLRTSQILKLCFVFPLSFVCLRQTNSTIYPPSTEDIHSELESPLCELRTELFATGSVLKYVTHDRRWGFTFRLRTSQQLSRQLHASSQFFPTNLRKYFCTFFDWLFFLAINMKLRSSFHQCNVEFLLFFPPCRLYFPVILSFLSLL